MVPQLQGVDLNNEAAVEAAIATAVKNKANPSAINAARNSIENYRKNKAQVEGAK